MRPGDAGVTDLPLIPSVSPAPRDYTPEESRAHYRALWQFHTVAAACRNRQLTRGRGRDPILNAFRERAHHCARQLARLGVCVSADPPRSVRAAREVTPAPERDADAGRVRGRDARRVA